MIGPSTLQSQVQLVLQSFASSKKKKERKEKQKKERKKNSW
jgi:hypothetical protein